MFKLFDDINEKNKNDAVTELLAESTASQSFYFFVILSVLMATYGLILNNTSIVIGSMLIAPILSPILSLGMGITISDNRLVQRSLRTTWKSIFYSVIVSMFATFLLWNVTGEVDFQKFYNPEILSRTQATMSYFFVAFIAGLATAYARVRPDINDSLPGTAIAVALVPPLATIGIGLATLNLSVALGAMFLFLLNCVGIVVASIVMFSLLKIYKKKKIVQKVLENEDTLMEDKNSSTASEE